MKFFRIRLITPLLISLGLAGSTSLAMAQTSGTTGTTGTTATSPATASNPTNKLVAEFTSFAGSEENAASLVNGLRTGSDITLKDETYPSDTGTTSGSGSGSTTGSTSGSSSGSTSGTSSTTTTDTTSTTFSPGTKPMGNGNVRIALSLARTQLASQGITNPTSQQIQGALVGTTGTDGTSSQGILQMRESGMGWGQIANSMGFKLGAVMSGKQTYAQATAAGTTTATGTSHGNSGKVTTAAGTSNGSGGSKGVVTGAGGASSGNAYGKSGITTAAGGNPHVTSAMGTGVSHGSGAVNAAGTKAGGNAGIAHGGGNGKGKP